MQTSDITWDELKNQYYHNLQTLQNSMDVAYTSSVELYRIYTEIMKKSRYASPGTMKKFTHLWLEKIDKKILETSPILLEKYNGLLKNSNPTEEDINEFERLLQDQFKDRAYALLASHHIVMQGFYDTWLEMWAN